MHRLILTMLLPFIAVSHSLGQRAIVATTDFSTGSISTVDTETQATSTDLLLIHGDAKVRAHGDRVYVINRLGQDNIIVLSKEDLATPITQYSTGSGSNPHEIAVQSDDKAYVTLYERDYLLIINPATGDSLGSIKLTEFADADGLPEASQLVLFDDHLFVAIQRLNRDAFFAPADYSLVAVIDTSTDSLVDIDSDKEGTQGIQLSTAQPFGHTQRGPKWILACVASFGAQDGGIEVVDLSTFQTEGLMLSETELGGDVGPLTMWSDNEGYIVMTDENFANSVRPFSLDGTVGDMLPDHSGGYTPAISVLGSNLYVLDRGTFSDPSSAGVKIYDRSSNTLTAGPISTGLPPSDIAFVGVRRADFDGDNDVDFDDFLRFSEAFGKTTGSNGYDSSFDLNPNGAVDFNDFLLFAEGFGK